MSSLGKEQSIVDSSNSSARRLQPMYVFRVQTHHDCVYCQYTMPTSITHTLHGPPTPGSSPSICNLVFHQITLAFTSCYHQLFPNTIRFGVLLNSLPLNDNMYLKYIFAYVAEFGLIWSSEASSCPALGSSASCSLFKICNMSVLGHDWQVCLPLPSTVVMYY